MTRFCLAALVLAWLFAVLQAAYLKAGEATHYTPGLGACGTTHSPNDMVVALSHEDYTTWHNPNNALYCGKCISVKTTGSGKRVKVQIVDQCLECPSGSLDLSTAAFEKLASLEKGRIPITWSTIKC